MAERGRAESAGVGVGGCGGADWPLVRRRGAGCARGRAGAGGELQGTKYSTMGMSALKEEEVTEVFFDEFLGELDKQKVCTSRKK